jgi:hypothetical protein
MLLCNEECLQAYWLDGRRSDPLASSACGRDLDVAAANKRSATDYSKVTVLQRHRPIGIRWSDRLFPNVRDALAIAGNHSPLALRRIQIVLAVCTENLI